MVPKYVDTHIHLSDVAYADDLNYVLCHLERLHIAACAVSMNYNDSVRTLHIANMSDSVFAFVGLHPECVCAIGVDDMLYNLTLLAEQNTSQIMGIGEIGLDPTLSDGVISSQQMHAFVSMLELASKLKKPVSIHSRKSLDDVFDVMTSFDASCASLHWFDGNKRQLARAHDMGFYISYGPVSVYANDKQQLISISDVNRILVETDGPVKFSRCFEQKSGQSCFVASVLYVMSNLHHMEYDRMADQIVKNSVKYLGLESFNTICK